MVDLKPCPFCGGKAKMHKGSPDGFFVACSVGGWECGVELYTYRGRLEVDAAGLWNHRTEDDEITTLRARIAELEAERDGIRDKALKDAAQVAVVDAAEQADAGRRIAAAIRHMRSKSC